MPKFRLKLSHHGDFGGKNRLSMQVMQTRHSGLGRLLRGGVRKMGGIEARK